MGQQVRIYHPPPVARESSLPPQQPRQGQGGQAPEQPGGPDEMNEYLRLNHQWVPAGSVRWRCNCTPCCAASQKLISNASSSGQCPSACLGR